MWVVMKYTGEKEILPDSSKIGKCAEIFLVFQVVVYYLCGLIVVEAWEGGSLAVGGIGFALWVLVFFVLRLASPFVGRVRIRLVIVAGRNGIVISFLPHNHRVQDGMDDGSSR
jgi:hypothetical protein